MTPQKDQAFLVTYFVIVYIFQPLALEGEKGTSGFTVQTATLDVCPGALNCSASGRKMSWMGLEPHEQTQISQPQTQLFQAYIPTYPPLY